MSSKLEQVKRILLEAVNSIEGSTEFEFDPDEGSASLCSKNILITFVLDNVVDFYEEFYIDCKVKGTAKGALEGYSADVKEEVWDVEMIEQKVKAAVAYFGRE